MKRTFIFDQTGLYGLNDNEELINSFLANNPVFSFDIETTGLNPRKDFMFSFAICSGKETIYFDIRNLWVENIEELIHRIFYKEYNFKRLVIGQNLKFDMSFIIKLMDYKEPNIGLWCTKIAHNMYMNTDRQSSLDALAIKYRVGRKDDAVEKYIVDNKLYKKRLAGKLIGARYDKVPREMVAEYCALDTELCYEIAQIQFGLLPKIYR